MVPAFWRRPRSAWKSSERLTRSPTRGKWILSRRDHDMTKTSPTSGVFWPRALQHGVGTGRQDARSTYTALTRSSRAADISNQTLQARRGMPKKNLSDPGHGLGLFQFCSVPVLFQHMVLACSAWATGATSPTTHGSWRWFRAIT